MADSTLVLAQLTIDDLPAGVPASGVSIELRAAAGGDEGGEPSPPLATAALEVANHTATMIGALSTPLPAAAPPAAEGEEAPGPFDSLAVAVTVEGGALYAEPTGQSRMPLVHRSGTTFFVGEAGAPMTVTFTLADGGGATAMELRRGDGPGRTFPKRVD